MVVVSEPSDLTHRRVKMELPPWIWGGKPARFLELAELHSWNVGGSVFEVQTAERYLRRSSQLVMLDHVGGPECPKSRFDVVSRAASVETVHASDVVADTRVDQHVARARTRGDMAGAVSANQLILTVARPDELQGLLRQLMDDLREVSIDEEPAARPFANAGVHLVRRSKVLLMRLKLPSVLLKVPTTSSANDRAALLKRNERGEQVFSASDNLRDGHYLFDAYTGPLLGALTPFVWGFAAYRDSGVIVVSLGTPVAGASGDAAELLQTLPTQSGSPAVPAPQSSAGGAGAALRWWVVRLDAMFAVISDPAVFAGSDGRYQPAAHLHALLTVEQLFRRIASIQASHRDLQARRVLLFSALDTIEKLTGRDLLQLTRLSRAQRAFDGVRTGMSLPAQEILIPAAERGLGSLRAVQAGFHRVDDRGFVALQDVSGERQISLEVAACHYVKMLRNATHGHGGKGEEATRATSLLEQHSGEVPHDLGLLAYLWLLDLLDRPDDLRTSLSRLARRMA